MHPTILITFVCFTSLQAYAQTWQELNKQSVELFNKGEVRKAASTAAKAVELYKKSENYTVKNYIPLTLMAAEFYEDFG